MGNALVVCGLIAYAVWVYLHRFEIRNDGDLYLTRYKLIRTPWFRVFLHRIWRPDLDRNPHNHPWPKAGTVVLWGGYRERVECRCTWEKSQGLSAGSVSTLAFEPGNYHRIVAVLPNTWTLFFAGRRTRSWGFLVHGKHVDHVDYLGYEVQGD